MGDRVGQHLGNYQLIRLLGEGGFAEVYLGEHVHLGTQAAIKVLHTQLTSDDVDKFRNEARTIARLIHPHIVRVLEFGVEGKTPFLVMDYASNGTLRQRHPKGTRLPLDTIVSYVKQVAAALQYAHDEKLIHRDIKPENMLLGRRNDILLSDFGIALVAQSSRYQSTQEMAGTMAYMAPEQIQGKPRPASDQYSLGIVVYEWLSGDRPFHGSLTELLGQHLSVPPPSLQEKVSTISSEVDQVIQTALAKDPKQRFGNVQTFATALEQAYQLAPAHQIPPPTEVPISSEPSLPIDRIEARSPSRSSAPTEMVTPQSQSFQLPAEAITSSPTVLPLPMKGTILSDGTQELVIPQSETDEEEESPGGIRSLSMGKLGQFIRRFSPVLVPLPFAILIFLFTVPFALRGLAYLPLLPLAVLLLALVVMQGILLYYAGSKDTYWALFVIIGYALFLVVGTLAIFGLGPSLLLLFIFLIAGTFLWKNVRRM